MVKYACAFSHSRKIVAVLHRTQIQSAFQCMEKIDIFRNREIAHRNKGAEDSVGSRCADAAAARANAKYNLTSVRSKPNTK